MHRSAVAILLSCADELKQLHGLEKLLPFLLNLPSEKLDADNLMAVAQKIDIRTYFSEETERFGNLRFLFCVIIY